MGGLGRKRKQARIVKKVRQPGRMAKLNVNSLDKTLQSKWDKTKSPAQNFADLGLTMNLRPNMRQTKEGLSLLEHAKVRLNKPFFASKQQKLKAERQ